ncbi:MAG: hypothetical protein LBI84_10380 [Propionibacteriaceae bacterium]|jgi:hypothetical protein|nr:hypothetical protein [Propionibacteriaceae bacterium]
MPICFDGVGVGFGNRRAQRRFVAFALALLAVAAAAGCAAAESRLADGDYTVAVALTGGSGRAGVQSPAKLVVADGAMTAEIVWTSPYYTFMEIDGVRYNPVNKAGENSVFAIPAILDSDMLISAETTAMSEPHVIDYTLRFDSKTLEKAG